jgi:hypothetical protein
MENKRKEKTHSQLAIHGDKRRGRWHEKEINRGIKIIGDELNMFGQNGGENPKSQSREEKKKGVEVNGKESER